MKIETQIERKKDHSFEIKIVIPAKIVAEGYQKILKAEKGRTTIKGFRKGQAPLELVEKKLGKDFIYQQLIQKIINDAYLEAIKKHDLKPIIPPKVSLISAEEGKDWQIKITSCETPEVKLGQLKEEVQKSNAKDKIWIPKKGKEGKENKDQAREKEQRIQQIISLILKTVTINLPKALIDYELTRKLSNLIDQLQKVGLTIDQYLNSKGITIDQLKEYYRQEIEANWKIELALEKIAEENKIEVSKEEVQKLQKTVNPYLASRLLRREKALEHLLNL